MRGTTVIPRGAADAGVSRRFRVRRSASRSPSPEIRATGASIPRYAGELAVLEAVRSVVAVGARPIGLTDCLNFGNPRKPEQYGEFVAAIDGLAHAARELGLPFVSGNVSLYNESQPSGQAVPPSADRRVRRRASHDVSRVVTPGLKARRLRVALGRKPRTRVGGSVLAELLGLDGHAAGRSTTTPSAPRSASCGDAHRARRSAARAAPCADGGMLDGARAARVRRAARRPQDRSARSTSATPLCEAGGFLVRGERRRRAST